MALQWYIKHVDTEIPENGTAYFGPFPDEELEERLNDYYADDLADSGELDSVRMEDDEASKLYINPREYWMEQLKKCT